MNHFPTLSNLCYLLKGDKVLLIMKKRGFGTGKYNGPGGKVGNVIKEETPEESAKREVLEETGYQINVLEPAGVLEFVWEKEKEDWNQRTLLYRCHDFSGNLVETEECPPCWFKISEIPLSQMWDDDQYWLADVLTGKNVNKRFFFDSENRVKRMEEV